MRRSRFFHLLALITLALVVAFAGDIEGSFTGDWSSSLSGVSGGFRMTLARGADGKPNCEVTFTIDGQEVKTVTKSLKVEGSKIEVAYDFTIEGYELRSTVSGQLVENRLEGKYRTVSLADGSPVDEGSWKAAHSEPRP